MEGRNPPQSRRLALPRSGSDPLRTSAHRLHFTGGSLLPTHRKSGLLFCSRNGKPLHQSSILRRKLHPVLPKLGQPKCGVHAFRRFRNTYLRNFTTTSPGLTKFWMGHAGEGMSDLYDKIKENVAFRKEVAEKAGIGFHLPSKKCVEPKQFSSKRRSYRVLLTGKHNRFFSPSVGLYGLPVLQILLRFISSTALETKHGFAVR